jgi:uncharacterized YigZ family protein
LTVNYRSPRAPARFEQEIKKSRFIGIVLPVATADDVRRELEKLQADFPDATHRCWAYVLMNPGGSPRMRFDDAGEPAGTAGKPILNVLTRKRIGDALVVVVRYFGGVKLGASGLVRAYSATASRVLESAELLAATLRSLLDLRLDYADEQTARRVLARLGLEVLSADYGNEVVLRVRASPEESAALANEISSATSGRAKWEPSPDAV